MYILFAILVVACVAAEEICPAGIQSNAFSGGAQFAPVGLQFPFLSQRILARVDEHVAVIEASASTSKAMLSSTVLSRTTLSNGQQSTIIGITIVSQSKTRNPTPSGSTGASASVSSSKPSTSSSSNATAAASTPSSSGLPSGGELGLGSVSRRCVRHCGCGLLLIRRRRKALARLNDGNEIAHPKVTEKDGNPRSELEGDYEMRAKRAELEGSQAKSQGIRGRQN